jgi:hypothetical protein
MNEKEHKQSCLSNEICQKIKTNEFEYEIKSIIISIFSNNIKISPCDIYPESLTEIDKTGEKNPRIRLKLNKTIHRPEHIIWDMLHEFGHGLSGITDETSIIREIEAWNRAYVELVKYPKLKLIEQSFFKYQRDCLETYFRNGFISKMNQNESTNCN